MTLTNKGMACEITNAVTGDGRSILKNLFDDRGHRLLYKTRGMTIQANLYLDDTSKKAVNRFHKYPIR